MNPSLSVRDIILYNTWNTPTLLSFLSPFGMQLATSYPPPSYSFSIGVYLLNWMFDPTGKFTISTTAALFSLSTPPLYIVI